MDNGLGILRAINDTVVATRVTCAMTCATKRVHNGIYLGLCNGWGTMEMIQMMYDLCCGLYTMQYVLVLELTSLQVRLVVLSMHASLSEVSAPNVTLGQEKVRQ